MGDFRKGGDSDDSMFKIPERETESQKGLVWGLG